MAMNMFNRMKKPMNIKLMKNIGPKIGKFFLSVRKSKSPRIILNNVNLGKGKTTKNFEIGLNFFKKEKEENYNVLKKFW